MWLELDDVLDRPEYFSLGIGARDYGLVWPDRRVQAELWQLKKSPQPVRVETVNAARGRVRITNRHGFTDLRDAHHRLAGLGRRTQLRKEGTLTLALPPGKTREIDVPRVPAAKNAGRRTAPSAQLPPRARHRVGQARSRDGLGADRPAELRPGGVLSTAHWTAGRAVVRVAGSVARSAGIGAARGIAVATAARAEAIAVLGVAVGVAGRRDAHSDRRARIDNPRHSGRGTSPTDSTRHTGRSLRCSSDGRELLAAGPSPVGLARTRLERD